MLTAIVAIDIILFLLIALWVGWINLIGNTEQRGGAGFVAFVLGCAIIILSAAAVSVWLIIAAING